MRSEILHEALSEAASDRPDEILVRFLGGDAYTALDLESMSRRVAGGLEAHGVKQGDRVIVFLENRVEFLVAWFACSMLGAVSVPINTAMRGPSLKHQLVNTGPVVVVCERQFAEVLADAADGLPLQPTFFVTGDPIDATGHCFQVLLDSEPLVNTATVHPSDPAVVMYTSGSTGPSKGAEITNRHMVAIVDSVQTCFGYAPGDIAYTCLPLYHANAMLATFLGALRHGATTVVSRRFSATRYWDEVRESGAKSTSVLGSMSALLWKAPPMANDADNPLERILCIPFPDGHYDEFESRFGVRLTSFFGITEMGVPIAMSYEGERRPGSCGKVQPGWECRLVDDYDEPVPPGAIGELLIRPQRPHTTLRQYIGMPEATLAATRNLWLHSGDYLRCDDEGWYYFVDRRGDAIRRSGENISTYEIETAFLSHTAIQDVAAFGVPAELGEEEVMVAVVLKPGATADASDLIEHVELLLPYFAVPRFIDFQRSLPKTENERIMRQVLRSAGVTDTTWDRGPTRRTVRSQR